MQVGGGEFAWLQSVWRGGQGPTLTTRSSVFLLAGIREVDGVRHAGNVHHHPAGGLPEGLFCPVHELLLVLGPGGWICTSHRYSAGSCLNHPL